MTITCFTCNYTLATIRSAQCFLFDCDLFDSDLYSNLISTVLNYRCVLHLLAVCLNILFDFPLIPKLERPNNTQVI